MLFGQLLAMIQPISKAKVVTQLWGEVRSCQTNPAIGKSAREAPENDRAQGNMLVRYQPTSLVVSDNASVWD